MDPLVEELNKGLKDGGGDTEDPVGVVEYLLKAVAKVLKLVGENVTAAALADLAPSCIANLFSDSGTRTEQLQLLSRPLPAQSAQTPALTPAMKTQFFNSNYPETKRYVEN